MLVFEKNNGNSVIIRFDSEEPDRKSRKLKKFAKSQKTLKSKNLLKSVNFPKINVKKIESNF